MSAATLRKFLLYLLGVLLAFIAIDRGAAQLLNQLVSRSEFRFSKVHRGGNQADILVLGNSRSVNAFYAPEMERLLNLDVLHLGFNGMSMEICEAILKDYLIRNTTPGMIIIEVTNLNDSNGHLKEQKMYRGIGVNIHALLRREYPLIEFFCITSNLYQFNAELFMRSLYYFNRSDQSWINDGKINDEALEAFNLPEVETRNPLAVDGSGHSTLVRIMEICETEGIKVKLVVSPYLPHYIEKVSMEVWVDDLRHALPDAAVVHDFSDRLKDTNYFADYLHINREGSLVLLKQMFNEGVFDQ